MATAAPSQRETKPRQESESNGFDPDSYRMTVGEHLEELRWRMVLALIGFGVVLGVCLFFGTDVLSAFCAPLVNTLARHDINPQVVTDEVGEGFMTFIEISVISATALASPWIIYQLWQFVAAGLYPHERKYVTRYLPLSITLLVGGMLFVYFLVLPWTISFLLGYGESFKTEDVLASPERVDVPDPKFVSVLQGDPVKPLEGQIWVNALERKMKWFAGG